MSLFDLLLIIIGTIALATALSELARNALWKHDKAVGCNCLDDSHWRADCPLHGWEGH